MNRKGFTLVEILAVVVVLAMLMILAFPNIVGLIKGSTGGVDKLNRDHITEAARLFGQEIYLCRAGNIPDGVIEVLGSELGDNFTCREARQRLAIGVEITLDQLTNNGYMSKHKCVAVLPIRIEIEGELNPENWIGTETYKITLPEDLKCN